MWAYAYYARWPAFIKRARVAKSLQVSSTSGVVTSAILGTVRKLTPPIKRNENLWCKLECGSFSTAWHDLPQLVYSFSRNYAAYTYILYIYITSIGPSVNFDGFSVILQLLAELRTCSAKIFFWNNMKQLLKKANGSSMKKCNSEIWPNVIRAISV